MAIVLFACIIVMLVLRFCRSKRERLCIAALRSHCATVIYGHEMRFAGDPDEWEWHGMSLPVPDWLVRVLGREFFSHGEVVLIAPHIRGTIDPTDATIELVARLPALRAISLEGRTFSDASIPTLCSLRSLKAIWLKSTSVSDRGIEMLARESSVRFIGVERAAIDVSGMDMGHLAQETGCVIRVSRAPNDAASAT